MNHCDDILDLISLHLDGALSLEQEQQLQSHLAQCETCRTLLEELTRYHTVMVDIGECEPPAGFAQGVMDAIVKEEAGNPKVIPFFRRPQIRTLTTLAACLAVCFGLYQGRDQLFSNGTSSDRVASGSVAATSASIGGGAPFSVDADALPENESPASVGPDSAFTASEPEVGAFGLEQPEPKSNAFDIDGQASTSFADMLMPETCAVLTLTALPTPLPDFLPDTDQWETSSDGQLYYLIDQENMDGLIALLDEDSFVLVETGNTGPCAVVLDN